MHFLFLVIFEVEQMHGRDRGKKAVIPFSKMFSIEPGTVMEPKGIDAVVENMLNNMVDYMLDKGYTNHKILSHSLTKVL